MLNTVTARRSSNSYCSNWEKAEIRGVSGWERGRNCFDTIKRISRFFWSEGDYWYFFPDSDGLHHRDSKRYFFRRSDQKGLSSDEVRKELPLIVDQKGLSSRDSRQRDYIYKKGSKGLADGTERNFSVLQIDTDYGGETDPGHGFHRYRKEDNVKVTAEADDGYSFEGFEGDCTGESCSLGMEEDKYVKAEFERDFDEEDDENEDDEGDEDGSEENNGDGKKSLEIEVFGDGGSEPGEGKHFYREGKKVEIDHFSGSNSFFEGLVGDCTGKDCEVEMEGDRKVKLYFGEEKDKVSVEDKGDEVSDSGYYPDTSVTGYRVKGETRNLEIKVDGKGNMTPEVGNRSYEYGESVDIGAEPAEGYSFEGFRGDCSGKYCTVQMTEDRTVEAVFEEDSKEVEYIKPYKELSVNVEGEGRTEPSEGDYYRHKNSTVDLKAFPEEGWTFEGWKGDIDTDEHTSSVFMEGDRQVTAVFSEKDSDDFDKVFISTLRPENVSEYSAVLRGRLHSLGWSEHAWFLYRKKGQEYWNSTEKFIVSSPGDFSREVKGLEPGEEYVYKFKVDDMEGGNGNESFRTEELRKEVERTGFKEGVGNVVGGGSDIVEVKVGRIVFSKTSVSLVLVILGVLGGFFLLRSYDKGILEDESGGESGGEGSRGSSGGDKVSEAVRVFEEESSSERNSVSEMERKRRELEYRYRLITPKRLLDRSK